MLIIENAQVYSNTLISSDVLWYRDTFGMMHQYSVPCIVQSLKFSLVGQLARLSLHMMSLNDGQATLAIRRFKINVKTSPRCCVHKFVALCVKGTLLHR